MRAIFETEGLKGNLAIFFLPDLKCFMLSQISYRLYFINYHFAIIKKNMTKLKWEDLYKMPKLKYNMYIKIDLY